MLSSSFGRRLSVKTSIYRRHATHLPTNGGDTSEITDLRYPAEWFPRARQLRRKLILHVGPTNSGKTYNALQRLQEAKSGFFAGPLRLLAHEVWSKLNASGKPCNLVTGEEVRIVPGATLTSSTLEMVNLQQRVEVAVIDEIQMIADPGRGYAWTAAVLGLRADEIHLCGEETAIDIIRALALETDDIVIVNQYKRLSALKVAEKSLMGNFKSLGPGDAYVSFSRTGIFEAKRSIERATGCGVALAYGALPPETRALQAAHFNDTQSPYNILVASDAIGMGLNLKIKRIVFETLHKYNGREQEPLSISQVKQIAGRAGRFDYAANTQTPGIVTCMQDKDLPQLRSTLLQETPKIRKAGIATPLNLVEGLSRRLPHQTKFAQILVTLRDHALTSPTYFLCGVEAHMKMAELIEDVPGLLMEHRYNLLNSPVSTRNPKSTAAFVQFARHLGRGDICQIDDIIIENGLDRALEEVVYALRHPPRRGKDRMPNAFTRTYNLADLEILHKIIIHYLWLSYRYRAHFPGMERAAELKSLTEVAIEKCLEETASRRVARASPPALPASSGDSAVLAPAVLPTKIASEAVRAT